MTKNKMTSRRYRDKVRQLFKVYDFLIFNGTTEFFYRYVCMSKNFPKEDTLPSPKMLYCTLMMSFNITLILLLL